MKPDTRTTDRFLPVLLLALLSSVAAAAAAGELYLTTSNDLISRDGGDDRYTASLAVELDNDFGRILIGERMFTDRERGWRHDETYLELARDLHSRWGWRTEVRAGLLRVGRGLFGESLQNQIHRWVGADQLDLEYVGGTDHFASLGATSESPLGNLGPFHLSGRAEAYMAPGFRSWMRAELGAERNLENEIAIRARVGVRIDDVDSFRLAPNVGESGWSAGLSVSWRRFQLGWSRNDHGTGADHLTLAVRFDPPAARTGAASAGR